MKTNALSLLALAGALFLMAACASEEANTKQGPAQKPGTDGLTAFVVGSGITRTTADYDGSGLNFYWTEGDHLWLKNNGTLVQDTKSDIDELLTPNPTIPTAVKRTATAKFYYEGDYYAPTYHVRYTGKENPVSDKVTIKAQQTQTLPNDAAHISEDGDCGTATATKSGIEYTFTLDHKAAYLTFMPYNANNILGVIITQIKVTADQAIAGEFNFDDNGIDLTSRPTASAANQSITLALNTTAGNTGFPIPNGVADYTKNGATMVLAPGTYSTLTVEYTLCENNTGAIGTITKTYNNLTLTAGKNRSVKTDLQIMDYSPWFNNIYMWDAVNSYWNNITLPDELESNLNYSSYGIPTASDGTNRWHNTTYYGYQQVVNASNSCKDLPNINELFYYVRNGDPHWDSNILWTYKGHLYTGGLWLKKQSIIFSDLQAAGYSQLASQADMKEKYYKSSTDAGKDLRKAAGSATYTCSTGTPTNTSNYFFLPALGQFYSPGYFSMVGYAGCYWSSNGSAGAYAAGFAYHLIFSASPNVQIQPTERTRGDIAHRFE